MTDWVNYLGGVVPATVIEYPKARRGVKSSRMVVNAIGDAGGFAMVLGTGDFVSVPNNDADSPHELENAGPSDFIVIVGDGHTSVSHSDPRVPDPSTDCDHAAALERNRVISHINVRMDDDHDSIRHDTLRALQLDLQSGAHWHPGATGRRQVEVTQIGNADRHFMDADTGKEWTQQR